MLNYTDFHLKYLGPRGPTAPDINAPRNAKDTTLILKSVPEI